MPETLISLEGGLDQRSASINAPKGTCSNMLNFEKDQGPGLVRRLGWCRYDGRITGPEIEDAIVCTYSAVNRLGTFQYGEQVQLASAGRSTLNAIFIGDTPSTGSDPAAITLAYPIQTFPQWDDPMSYPAATNILGLTSGATVSVLLNPPVQMNDSSISILLYDNLKRTIQRAHSQSVKVVPGRSQSPVDATFTYANNSYAIHDCVTFTFNTGGVGTGVQPIEGHTLRDNTSGNRLGTILAIRTISGDWQAGTAIGQITVYDYPIGQAFPAPGDRFDLYNAAGAALITANIAKFDSQDPLVFVSTAADPKYTRALLYSTYEQYVKDNTYYLYGKSLIRPPAWRNFAPPTWSRVRMPREIPYTTVGLPAGAQSFLPPGTQDYSIYEYSRQGLTKKLTQLSPINTGEKFPTVATDPTAGVRWLNFNNIKVQDGATADYNLVSGASGFVTVPLTGSGFDFSSIPDNSTILGVVFRQRALCTTAGAYRDNEVRLVSSAFPNGISTTNKAGGFLPGVALTDFTYGSSGDLWGEQLTTAIIKDPSFGVLVKWQKANAAAAQSVHVDAYAMTVYYVPQSRLVYIRDQTITGAPSQDILANVIHYCVDTGDLATQTGVGVLTVLIGDQEYQGTAAGKIRRLAAGNEIRTAPSNPATNAAGGLLLAYVAAEDYPVSFPPSVSLDANISRYEVIDANFWDVPEGRAAYLANGVEYATMFDGTFMVRIRTGRPAVSDNPRHLAAHLSYLHLGFQSGAVVNTGTGKPLSTIGAIGAAVYNFGEPITGLQTLNGQTLGCWTDRATRGLQGNSPTTAGGGSGYTPIMISPAINCIEYSLVNLVGESVWMSYRGVETARTVNAYGDFETLPLSAAAQLWLQGRIQVDLSIGSQPSRLLYSIGVRNKRQYRAYFADGFVYTLTLFDAGDLPVSTLQRLQRPNATTLPAGANQLPTNSGVIRHIYNGTRSDGKEIILASFENQNDVIVPAAGGANIGPYFPYAVRIDCGYSDDIAPYMFAWVEFNAFYAGFPTQDQKWGNITVFMNAYGGSQLTLFTKTNFDGPIFDFTYNKSFLQPVDPQVQQRTWNLPIIESKAFIPVPQRTLKGAIDAEGRCLKLLIDGTQQPANFSPALVPVRITHLGITTTPLAVDRS